MESTDLLGRAVVLALDTDGVHNVISKLTLTTLNAVFARESRKGEGRTKSAKLRRGWGR